MNCPSCSKAVSGAYEAGSYSCSGCGGQIQVNPSEADNIRTWKRTTRAQRKDEAIFFALQVIVKDPKIRAFLEANDPKALEQAEDAISEALDNPARHKHVAFGREGANKRWGKAKATASKKKAKKNPVERLPGWSAPEFLRKYGRGSGSGSAKEWAQELKFEHPTNRQMVVGLVADLLYQMDTSQVDARNEASAAFLKRYQEWMDSPANERVSTSPNVRFPFI